MKAKLLTIVFLVLVINATAQINLPVSKSPISKARQKIKLARDNAEDLIRMLTPLTDDPKALRDSIDHDLDARELQIEQEAAQEANFPARAQISGLGNISASQQGEAISPSASIYATLYPYKSPNLKFNFLFNLGVNGDSSNIDSLKLGSLFFPDKTKTGFGFRISYDFFSLIKNKFKNDKVYIHLDEAGYQMNDHLEPYIEYNYSKFNFRNSNADSSNLQTGTLLIGLSYTHTWEKDDNIIGFIITPYYRTVKVTDGTYGLYKKIFDPTVTADKNRQQVNFLGINTSLQINRFLFSFIYESLKTKSLKDTPLSGGVFTIKATVTGDLIKL